VRLVILEERFGHREGRRQDEQAAITSQLVERQVSLGGFVIKPTGGLFVPLARRRFALDLRRQPAGGIGPSNLAAEIGNRTFRLGQPNENGSHTAPNRQENGCEAENAASE